MLKGWDPPSGLAPSPVTPEAESSGGLVDVGATDVEVLVDMATDVDVLVDVAGTVEVAAVVPVVSSLPEVATVDDSVTAASETDVVVSTVGSEVSMPTGAPPQAPATSTQASRALRDLTPPGHIS